MLRPEFEFEITANRVPIAHRYLPQNRLAAQGLTTNRSSRLLAKGRSMGCGTM